MKLLGFETSSASGTVALHTGAGVSVRSLATPRAQTEQILRLTDELLGEAGIDLAELDGITFGRGPGSFTGLRVSAAVAQGLAAAAGLPLLPVSSLLCIAERAWREASCERCMVCIDAHMGEVFWALAERRDNVMAIVGSERLGAPTEVAAPAEGPWAAVGNGFTNHAVPLAPLLGRAAATFALLEPAAEHLFPQALRDLAAGRSVPAVDALPVYLREHTAWRRGS